MQLQYLGWDLQGPISSSSQCHPIVQLCLNHIVQSGVAAQAPQPTVSHTVSSHVPAVPAHPPALAQSLGCSDLQILRWGRAGARWPLTPSCPGTTTNVHYCSPKKGFLLGTGCPLEGPLWHGVKQKGGASQPPRGWRQGWVSCALQLHSGFAHHLGQWSPHPAKPLAVGTAPACTAWTLPSSGSGCAQHPGVATALQGPRPYGGDAPAGPTGPAEMREQHHTKGSFP